MRGNYSGHLNMSSCYSDALCDFRKGGDPLVREDASFRVGGSDERPEPMSVRIPFVLKTSLPSAS